MTDRLILKNVRIFDVNQSVFNDEQNVRIEKGIITGIDRFPVDEPSSEHVVDCQGKYVIPGLWECHAHISEYAAEDPEYRNRILSYYPQYPDISWDTYVQGRLQAFLDHGITHIRDVGGPLNSLSTLKQLIENGKYSGPEICYAGPMLEKPPLYWQSKNTRQPGYTEPVETKKDVDIIIERLINGGASLVKTFNKFDREFFEYLVSTAGEYQLPVTHDPGEALYHQIPMDYAMQQGIRCFEHAKAALPVILKTEWAREHDNFIQSADSEKRREFFEKVLIHQEEAIARDRLDMLCRTMIDQNVCYCPTLWTLSSLRMEYKNEAPNEREARRRKLNEAYGRILRLIVETMASHAVKILVGHDSCSPGGNVEEMEFLEQWGVAPSEIIKGTTCYPAQWLGVNDRYGEIRESMAADLVILDQNPLLKISNIRTVHAVLHRGKWMPVNQGDNLPKE
ncbi:amidohydrolase family protein [bacterium]|nr:amidohydrolase family protein [candidate division CSSED10-310 bacterium]